MANLLLVGIGGFFGAISRYGISLLFPASRLHLGTLAVNLIGCLIIGVAFGFLSREAISKPAYLIVVTGFLGGFTTFSAFGLDTLKMIHDGAFTSALLYIAVSTIAGAALVAAGYELAK
ncbi:MAG: fluoride efflux transporter CrcB [Verrucomicrobiales bacterium]